MKLVSSYMGYLIACAALFSVLQSPARAQDDVVVLLPKLEVGQHALYDTTMHTRIKQSAAQIPGGAIAQTVDRTARIQFEVVNRTNEIATVTATYERISMNVDDPFPGLVYEFDSSKDQDAADENEGVDSDLATVLRPIVGMTITLKVTLTGEIQDVVVPPDSRPVGPMGGVALPFVEGKYIKSELAPIFSLGAGPARHTRGSRWDHEESNPLDMGVVLNRRTSFLVTTVGKSQVKTTLNGSMGLDVLPTSQLARAEVESSSISGTASWNHTQGWLQSLTLKETLNLVAEQVPGQSIRLESASEQTITRADGQ